MYSSATIDSSSTKFDVHDCITAYSDCLNVLILAGTSAKYLDDTISARDLHDFGTTGLSCLRICSCCCMLVKCTHCHTSSGLMVKGWAQQGSCLPDVPALQPWTKCCTSRQRDAGGTAVARAVHLTPRSARPLAETGPACFQACTSG